MSDLYTYDAAVVVTPKDFKRVESCRERIVKYLPVRKVLFVGSEELGQMVKDSELGIKAGFVDENDLIPFDAVYQCMREVMADILKGRELPRGIVGWYYQQFLKMQYSRVCKDKYYLSWDGDTVPCREFTMFAKNGKPFFDMKHEYHDEYFVTMKALDSHLGKEISRSFISEHMLFECEFMKEMLQKIEGCNDIPGKTFWEKILHAVRIEHIQENSFSEFETYGTYMSIYHPQIYEFRNWNSFRYGGLYFRPEQMSERDYNWLAKDFYAITFEKRHTVRPDLDNLFNNPVYQNKLSARQMLEIAQEESEGYEEVWEEPEEQKKRLVFTVGVYDTLDLFTEELNRAFLNRGYETLILDVRNLQEDLAKLAQFIKEPVAAGIVFNNLGFNMELVEGQNLWEQLNIPCINILMDHPCFYHKALAEAPCNAVVLCTDKNHMKYIGRFYPNIPVAGYLPHAGCIHVDTYKKLEERSIDVLYAGGLSAYVNEGIRPDWSKYQKFDGQKLSEDIYRWLIQNPSMTTEAAVEEWFAVSEQDITDDEFRLLMTDMRYIEGLAVSYYRERTVKCLVESGINVTVYGLGWAACDWASNPNLNYGGRIPAKDVLEEMKEAKIVLSTMTWFKDGTHDRVFNGMLAGAVAVTDTSKYMRENFKDMRKLSGEEEYSAAEAELVFFELAHMQELPKKIQYLLGNLQEAQKIADRGYRLAGELHTWDVRAKEIEEALLLQ